MKMRKSAYIITACDGKENMEKRNGVENWRWRKTNVPKPLSRYLRVLLRGHRHKSFQCLREGRVEYIEDRYTGSYSFEVL